MMLFSDLVNYIVKEAADKENPVHPLLRKKGFWILSQKTVSVACMTYTDKDSNKQLACIDYNLSNHNITLAVSPNKNSDPVNVDIRFNNLRDAQRSAEDMIAKLVA